MDSAFCVLCKKSLPTMRFFYLDLTYTQNWFLCRVCVMSQGSSFTMRISHWLSTIYWQEDSFPHALQCSLCHESSVHMCGVFYTLDSVLSVYVSILVDHLNYCGIWILLYGCVSLQPRLDCNWWARQGARSNALLRMWIVVWNGESFPACSRHADPSQALSRHRLRYSLGCLSSEDGWYWKRFLNVRWSWLFFTLSISITHLITINVHNEILMEFDWDFIDSWSIWGE